jgi:flagellin
MGETSADIITSSGGVSSNTSGLTLKSLKSVASTSGGLTQSSASALLSVIDNALNTLNSWRADFGSTQNQLESSLRNMNTTRTNIKAAESVIRDVDYASESAEFNKQNIIAQAGTYALSQANAMQQNVTRLLQ